MTIKQFCDNSVRKFFRAVPTVENLASVRRIDPNEADPSELGLKPKDLEKIWQNAEDVYRTGMHPMMNICLRRHGKIALHRSVGHSHFAGKPNALVAELDTPVCLFSASKVVAAVLMHKLAEDGHLDLLNPVSYYLPEFARAGKGNITVYQLLSHRAGVPGIPPDVPIEVLYDHDTAFDLICQQEALDPDGRVVAYHALTGGFVMSELIQKLTGKSVNEYLDEVIRKPMGMGYFHYGMPQEKHKQAAINYLTGAPNKGPIGNQLHKVLGAEVDTAVEISNSEPFLNATIPAGNLYATAEEASRFFQMLLQQGEWQGKQILKPITVHRLTREAGRPQFDRSLGAPLRYSAGTMLGGRFVGLYGRHTPHAFGHIGFSNIVCWADPERDISVAILNNGKPILGTHIPGLLKMIDSISQGCSRCVDMHDRHHKMVGALEG
ncbi:beta-lactamase family protein [Spongiibacter sp. KMU-158]|uniref:Beta-lactamase family protein n=1 Tax=Spongiibacter pelagi TaxID=2760804 RepID=A0A927GWJ0_9GAMM|nr:serine hydrolase domain-containing protein [Spongiibacter pelagi]MBD2858992.1 beta-lactamase family protein [Spongiibacter pelagi]